jgi:magnesium transporter
MSFRFRDIYDHLVRIADDAMIFQDRITGMLDAHLSNVSNRLNEVMKVLTIISTIFIPLNFIAGIYGMNFNPQASPLNMPELNWYFGYPAALSLMAVVGGLLVVYFRRRGWF